MLMANVEKKMYFCFSGECKKNIYQVESCVWLMYFISVVNVLSVSRE